jgi:hypothetical protein
MLVAHHGATFATPLAGFDELRRRAPPTGRHHFVRSPTPEPGGSRAADDALAAIEAWLRQHLWDWDVTNADLHNIASTLRSLAPADLTEVLLRLDRRLLVRWLEEMRGRLNGFSQGELREVFALLAARASGPALGRVVAAVAGLRNTRMATDLSAAVALHTPQEEVPALVEGVVDLLDPGDHWGALVTGHLLHALTDPEVVDAVVGLLVADRRRFARAIERGAFAAGRVPPLHRGEDAGSKAAAFVALVAMLDDVRSWPQLHDQIDDALTAMIESDPPGVLESLAIVHDRDGVDLTRWLRRLVADSGRLDHLSRTIRAVAGPGPKVAPSWFAAPGTDDRYPYPNAQNLAYVMSSLQRAVVAHAADRTRLVAAMALVAGVAESVVSARAAVTGPVGVLVPAASSLGVGAYAWAVTAGIDSALATLLADIEERFEVEGDGAADWSDVGRALAAFDARRDLLMRPREPGSDR